MKLRPAGVCRSRQASDVCEGLYRSGASVKQRSAEGAAADPRSRRIAIQQLDVSLAQPPLTSTLRYLRIACISDGTVKSANLLRLAVDPKTRDKFEDETWRVRELSEQSLAPFLTEHGGGVIRHRPRSGVNKTDVTSRRTETCLACLEHHRVATGLSQVQRRGTAREASSDDRDFGRAVALERTDLEARWRSVAPQTVGFGPDTIQNGHSVRGIHAPVSACRDIISVNASRACSHQ